MDESIFERSLEDQLCFEVYKAANGFSKLYKRALKPYQLTFPQYLVLLALWEDDGVIVKVISDRLGMSIGTLNPILNRLALQGWAEKKPSSEDKRASIVTLTEKAKREKKAISMSILHEVVKCNQLDIDGNLFLENLKDLNKEFERTEKIADNSEKK
ncbi:MarR family transcriptional regulator [Desemzia sp. RIT804]|uniref:MarR family winged helix-turn-helix transcriptional regulator n=1 Tax=Desemzia sp. RIT 804 TaxID=2810209 RepID=UPI001951933B|nr:MarR family transcriptional regulator [Desemzia sp. RIT 804]MBM6613278.1 MarR family transcriptional regulator [Desemzia sp. RIT 804]